MRILHRAALGVPAIRRLRDNRNALLEERANLIEERAALLAVRDRLLARVAELESPENLEAMVARAENRLIITEYPYYPSNRPIQNGAGGRRLIKRLESEEPKYAETLRGIAQHVDGLLQIPREERQPDRPYWKNDWFPPFDAASIYGLIAELRPERYIEVGSGISTRFARQAINDMELHTRIVSIDPHPHTAVDQLCDEIVRSKMEDLPSSFWNDIGPKDILFVDNSHRSFPNSDVTAFWADVLPALKAGTTYGIHDILLPWDYPQDWNMRFYNEQYLLLSYLLGGADGDAIILPVRWASEQPSLHGILGRLWARNDLMHGVGTHGGCFWMRRSHS